MELDFVNTDGAPNGIVKASVFNKVFTILRATPAMALNMVFTRNPVAQGTKSSYCLLPQPMP